MENLNKAIASDLQNGNSMQDKKQQSRGQQIVESLLAKPSKKPDFASVMLSQNQPDVLRRAQAFLPAFIQNTDKILNSPDLMRANQMDIKISRSEDFNPATQEKEFQQAQEGAAAAQDGRGPAIVNMDIGVGVFDVNNVQDGNGQQNVAESGQGESISQLPSGMGFHQTSTEPILRIFQEKKAEKQKRQQEQRCPEHKQRKDSDSEASSDSESSDSEPDDDQFMEFDSSSDSAGAANGGENDEMKEVPESRAAEEEMIDAQSHTTKSSCKPVNTGGKSKAKGQGAGGFGRGPLIQEIASIEFSQNPEEESKEEVVCHPQQQVDSTVGMKRKFRER